MPFTDLPPESIDDFDFTWTRKPRPTAADTAAAPHSELFLLIRYATAPSEADDVLAALTTRPQAQALLDTYERLEAASSGYEIVPIPVHTSAADALGL
ncbi:hypothetical protein [Nocardiopsis sp. L17-MgMaSL7]|uniref:hypothetical protein n=1 Tax=Nocardiopsis sp. L17-MgMaSL7 TaxID=1938893 RepID=UPI000D716E57|nr:hypothetical protein [Nocardiopsis sp. L17-MgMaSL7]PWV44548.1 hypothetical protein BDW27_1237 [Nocardiopsis sp. L17-MgMaSL7]